MNPVTQRPLRRTHRALRVLALLCVLALVLAAVAWQSLHSLDWTQLHVLVDGDEVLGGGAALSALQPGHHLLAVLLVAALLMALLLAVPLLLLALAVVVLPIVLLAFGLPLVVVLAVAAMLLAPLAVVGLLGWWLIRALWRENKAPPSATMAG
jgi:hypothetical protein